ncbi:hypothetical protein A2U01_0094729, partial [Trifolium medium]|nr:hypothetical protein [Trifolium medium]
EVLLGFDLNSLGNCLSVESCFWAEADTSTLVCLPPQLEPPIASWVLSRGMSTMELISRVVLVGQ